MEPLNAEQVKEPKYLYENQALRDLSLEEPDAILFWDGEEQALITKNAGDLDNAYEKPMDFFMKKVNRDYKGDLNKFAKSLGYGLGKASFSMGDFLADWNDLNQDSLKELIFEYFDGEELGDIYDD